MAKINIWYLSSLLISLIVLIPIATVSFSFFEETSEYYKILKDTFLIEYILNSTILLLGVLIFTFIFGTGTAYLVSFYNFPGSNFFKWALILSFAVPPYIYAYSIFAFFENYGTAFTILKSVFGEGNYNRHIPKFDGMFGAIISLSFSLFAYVYILARASFLYQSQNLIDLSKNLGFSKISSFFKVILPSARPAIVAGLSLVAMETLAEFGAVDFFSINTLTTGIYNSWITFDDLAFANRLSFFLLLFIFALFILENLSRKQAKYHSNSSSRFKQRDKYKLSGGKGFLAFLFCFVIFFLSFVFPLSQMLYWTIIYVDNLFDLKILRLIYNTLYLVFLSSLALIVFSFISNYGMRISKSKPLNVLNTLSISGYAIPGVILAIAFITFISWIDNSFVKSFGFQSVKKIFFGSILGLVIVYFIRFYSLACNGIKSGYEKINISVDESAYLLGYSKIKTFINVHIPYLRNSILFVGILISLEIIRELPITLILRPFNFETLATATFDLSNQAQIIESSIPSLFIIFLTLIPIIYLNSRIGEK